MSEDEEEFDERFEFNGGNFADQEYKMKYNESMTSLFNRKLKALPADLSDFVEISIYEPYLIFTENLVNRLIIVLLNENDIRISDKVCNLCTEIWTSIEDRIGFAHFKNWLVP